MGCGALLAVVTGWEDAVGEQSLDGGHASKVPGPMSKVDSRALEVSVVEGGLPSLALRAGVE